MEAFVVLIAEVLVAPVLAGLVILLETVLTAVAGLLQWKKGSRGRHRSRFLKWTTICLFGLFSFTVLGTFAVNALWFEPAVRLVLSHVEEKNGIRVTFESATGNLFTGSLKLTGAVIERASHPTSTFYLNSNDITADLAMWQLILRKPVLQYLHIGGLSGTIERKAKSDTVELPLNFVIRDLTLENADLLVKDKTHSPFPAELKVRIDKFNCRNFRSSHMAYDALLRSMISGNINGSPYTITKNPGDNTQMSNWKVDRLRLDQFGDFMLGSWNVIGNGFLTIEAQNTFLNTRPTTVDMKWRLKFTGISLHRPDKLIKRFLKMSADDDKSGDQKGKAFTLEFSFDCSEDQFLKRPSLEAAGVWKRFREMFGEKTKDTLSNFKKNALPGGNQVKDRFSDFFNKERGNI